MNETDKLHAEQERLWGWHDMRRKSAKQVDSPCRINRTGRATNQIVAAIGRKTRNASMSKHKEKNPPFVMITNQVLDSPAWRAMSHGARNLYISLKRRYWPNRKNNGRIYITYRQAHKELRSGYSEIARWFRELQYYGFIVMTDAGCLGLDGKGKAPRWRLTEVAYMRGTSSKGTEDMPTMDFLKWNGVRFSKHYPSGDHLKPHRQRRSKREALLK
jgi:hypothetical protein